MVSSCSSPDSGSSCDTLNLAGVADSIPQSVGSNSFDAKSSLSFILAFGGDCFRSCSITGLTGHVLCILILLFKLMHLFPGIMAVLIVCCSFFKFLLLVMLASMRFQSRDVSHDSVVSLER